MKRLSKCELGSLALTLLLLLAVPALAQPTFEIIGNFYVHDMTPNGTAASGVTSDGSWEACRWTADGGITPLGQNALAILGNSAGTTGISSDGLRVGATIATLDSTAMTGGRWTVSQGWEEVMPPIPPDGGIMDDRLGSAWDLSGDGETVVGLYWRPGASDGSAHAYAWRDDTGLLGLGGLGYSSRAMAVNHDGTTVGGYAKHPDNYVPLPAIWEIDGQTVTLIPMSDEFGGEVRAINSDGTIVAGNRSHPDDGYRSHSTLWFKSGTEWNEVSIGYLPGTGPDYGTGIPEGLSDDASIVVGTNRMSLTAYSAFIWTVADGMMTPQQFFDLHNVPAPAGYVYLSISAVSPDGKIIAGYGWEDYDPGTPITSFIVNLDPASPVPDAVTSGNLQLSPAFPNPFNPSTSFELSIERDGQVNVEIFDARGRLVRVLQDGLLNAGSHVLRWDGHTDSGGQAASGVYMARARTDDGAVSSRQMMLVK